MKYLSHFTIRAFVVIGLSLGFAKAQLSKKEVMIYFECLDIKKLEVIADKLSTVTKNVKPLGGVKGAPTYIEYEENWNEWYSKPNGKLEVYFYENSLLFQYGTRTRMYTYQHIKMLHHSIVKGKQYLFISN
ncbi:hypothetical protein OAF10_00385 [bacterium]|nr:hypothetical protein [bacterium]